MSIRETARWLAIATIVCFGLAPALVWGVGAKMIPDPAGPAPATGKVTVSVVAMDPGTGVISLDIDFTYDPSVLRFVSCVGTVGGTGQLPSGWTVIPNSPQAGLIQIGANNQGTAPSLTATGNTVVALVTFEVITPCDPMDELHFALVQYLETEVCNEEDGNTPANDCTPSWAPGVDHGRFDLNCGVIRMPEDTIGRTPGYIEVPVTVRYAGPTGIESIDMIVDYNQSVLTYQRAILGPHGASDPMYHWTLVNNEAPPGKVNISLVWDGLGDPLLCSAEVAILVFQVKTGQTNDATSPLTISLDANGDGTADYDPFNEALPPSACLDDGLVKLTTETCNGLDDDGDGTIDEYGNALCDNGLWCDGTETCAGTAGCQAGSAPCNDSDLCTQDNCDEDTRTCSHTPVTDGTSCTDDGLECTNDICTGGACTHPNKTDGISCTDDGFVCTNDVCGSGLCIHPANTAPCDDLLYCNGADTCSGGTCSVHAGNPCATDELCNESTDQCCPGSREYGLPDVLMVSDPNNDGTYTDSEFIAQNWGSTPAPVLVSRTNVAGPGVEFKYQVLGRRKQDGPQGRLGVAQRVEPADRAFPEPHYPGLSHQYHPLRPLLPDARHIRVGACEQRLRPPPVHEHRLRRRRAQRHLLGGILGQCEPRTIGPADAGHGRRRGMGHL